MTNLIDNISGFSTQPHDVKNVNSDACKVSESAFAIAYDNDSIDGQVQVTLIDRFTKSATLGSAQTFFANPINICGACYLEDNVFLIVYNKTSDALYYAKVCTVSGSVITFGAESACLAPGLNYIAAYQNLKLQRIDENHVAIGFGTFMSTDIVMIETNNTLRTVASIGTPLNLNSANEQFIHIDLISSSKIGLTGSVTDLVMYIYQLTYNTTTLSFALEYEMSVSLPEIPYMTTGGFLEEDKAIIFYINNTKGTYTYTSSLCTPSTNTKVDLATDLTFNSVQFFRNPIIDLHIISNGCVFLYWGYLDGNATLTIWNIWNNDIEKNYTENGVTTVLNAKNAFRAVNLGGGDYALIYGDPDGFLDALFSRTFDFLGGISAPDLNWTNPEDFGKIEIGSSVSESFVHQNDGIFGEDVEITTPEGFYFVDDDGNVVQNATVRVPGTQDTLEDGEGFYINDGDGNPIISGD
jgi:hypothetical protein